MSEPSVPTTNEEPAYYYPNLWTRLVLVSAEEVLGAKGVAVLLNRAGASELIDNYPPDNTRKEFPFQTFSNIQGAFWEMFGERGGRVFAIRAGERRLELGLDAFGPVSRALQSATQSGNLEARVRLALQFFARFINAVSDQKVHLDEDEQAWYWVIERCPICWGRTSGRVECYLEAGTLQAAGKLVADGTMLELNPIGCIARGDPAGVIRIDKPGNR
jgi:hypothetical protein